MHFIEWYARASGVTAMHIDFARKRVLRSRPRSIYAMCINVAFASVLLYLLRYGFDMTDNLPPNSTANMSQHTYIKAADSACVLVLFAVLLLIVALRRRHERLCEIMAREFFALDCAYFDQVPLRQSMERSVDLLLFGRSLPIYGHIVSNIMVSLYLSKDTRIMFYMLILSYNQAYFMAYSLMFQYFASLAQARKRFQLLNAQLGKLLDTLRGLHVYAVCVVLVDDAAIQQQRQSAVAELQQISRAHWRLTCLVQRICNIFFIQATVMLLTNTMQSIIAGYFALIIIDGTMHTKSAVISSLQILTWFMLISDTFCLYRLSDATTYAHKRCSEILREFQTLPLMDVAFERCSESFSLQLLKRRLDISMGGMFSLNRETLLALWAFILSYTIVMVQFDFALRLAQQNVHQ